MTASTSSIDRARFTTVRQSPPANVQAPSSARGNFGRWAGRLLSPAAGLELSGIDIGSDLPDEDVASLRALLCRHKVLVFRRQGITPAQHVAFARRFGELEVHPFIEHHAEHPELVCFRRAEGAVGTENVYHSDTSCYPTPSMGSILRCVECPEVGGDTIFVNMVAAFEGLPSHVKAMAEKLTAMHDASIVLGNRMPTPEGRAQIRKEIPPVEHPVVRTHPETGEKILYVNETFTTHFANYRVANAGVWNQDTPTQARELMALLMRQARTPEYQLRMQWEKDTVVFWDNRSVQHYAISDYYPNVREMMRATVVGDRPR